MDKDAFLDLVATVLVELHEDVCPWCEHDPNFHAVSCPIGRLEKGWDRFIVGT